MAKNNSNTDNHPNLEARMLLTQMESLSKMGSWELDVTKSKLTWSDGVFQMLGYQPQEFEVTFEKGLEVIHPEDRERATALMEEVLQNDTEYFIEKRLITKHGNSIYVRSKANIFKDEKGNPVKLIGVFQDISDFVNTQNQLIEQHSLTKDIIQNLPAAFFLFNEKQQHLLWNKQLEDITGYSHDEIAEIKPIDFYTGEEKVKVAFHIKEVLEKGYTELEAWLTKKDKQKIPLFFTASTIQYKGERCIFGTGTDISQRLGLIHELELLTSNTDEAFMYIDDELKVVSFNHQMKTHYDLIFEKKLKKGLKLTELAYQEQSEELNQIIKQVWQKEHAKTVLKVTIDGEKKYYELKFKPILTEAKKVNGIFITSINITEAYTANLALKGSQQKLQQVLDSSLDTLCTIDEEGIFQMVSKSSEQLWGYKPEELEGKPFMNFVHEDDRELTAEVADNIQNGRQYRNFENRYIHKKGHIVPVVWSAHWDQEQNLMNCVARDASDKLAAEEHLKLSESRFKSLVQEGGDLIAIVDQEGIYKYVSPTSTNILGIKPEEFIGKNAFDFFHPDDKEWAISEFGKLENEKHVQLPAFRFINNKGEWRWLESQISNLMDEPSVQGIVANSRDVTERIKIEKELIEGKERLELVMKAGSESIWDYDVAKEELYLGQGYLKKYGFKNYPKLSNIELHDALVHPDDFARFKSSILNALENPKISEWQESYRFLKKNGNYAHVEDRAVILRDKKGNALRAVGAIKDVTHEFISDQHDELEKTLLQESILAEKSLLELLKNYLDGIDQLFEGMKTSILSVVKQRLKNLCSPNLPKGYLEEIDELPIGLNQGSCGTAAYLGKQVVVTDIHQDERWQGYTHLGDNYGFKSCWSEPIFNEKGKVIATFAIYHDEIKSPKDLEVNIFERAASLISIVLQNFAYIKSIQQINERFKYINKATNNAIYEWNVMEDQFYWGNSLTRVFGHQLKDEKFGLRDWTKWVHPDDLEEVLQDLDMFMADAEESKWSYEYRFQDANGNYAYVEEVGYLIRDEKGMPKRMIGALRDQTYSKQEQIKQELQYELSQIFKKADSLTNILQESIKFLSEFGGYQAGEVWLMSHNQKELHLSAWYAKNGDKERFYTKNSKKVFEIGEGLPGTVWQNLENEVWNEIDLNHTFVRNKLAQKANLKSAVGYPLYYQEKLIGVMVLFAENELKQNDHSIAFYNNLKQYFGAEIMRKQQEEELNLFFNDAPEILAVASPEGYFVKVNPAFCNLLGYPEEEIISTPFSEFVHPNDLMETTKEFGETITGERHSNNFLNRYRTREGKYKWISWYSSDAFGQDGFVFSYGRDVTEMVELQETIENASKLARVGGWEVNLKDNTVYFSDTTKEIHEVDADFEPTIEKGINFHREDYKELIKNDLRNAIEKDIPWDREFPIITAKGNEKWIRGIGKAEFENGKCVRVYGSFQDIHDRKLAEIRLQNISNNIPGVIFRYHLKADGRDLLELVSKGAEQIFGFSPEECMESTEKIWKNIAAGGNMPEMKASILQSAETMTPWHFVWRYIHPNGNIQYHEGFGNPQKSTDGTVVWDSIITDITDKRELEILAERTSALAKIGSWELNLSDGLEQVYWSPMTRKILEVDQNFEPSVATGLDFYINESKSIMTNAVENLIEKGKEFDLELLIRTQNGKEKWVRCIGQADRVKGETKRIFGSFQDIDLQKRTKLAVQEGLKEKEDILESIGDAFFAVDNDWIVTYWNKEAEKILFKKKKDILFKNLWDEYQEAIPLKFYEEYHKAMKTQKTVEFEEYFPPLDKWFEVSAYPAEKGLSVYFKDITLRKTADDRIKASNERFEKAALATNDAIWDWDLIANKVTRAGSGFENMFGYKAEIASNEPNFWENHIHPKDVKKTVKAQDKALKDKECNFLKLSYRFKRKSGDYAHVIDKGYIERNEQGKAIRMIGATTDVTERKNYEKSLLEVNEKLQKQTHDLQVSNAELEQFAYVASHDLQEPLRMVSSFLTQLEKKYGNQLDEKAHQYIDFAVDGAKRMRQIILDLLDYSKIGKSEEENTEVDLNEVVHEVCLLQRKNIEELGANIEFKNLPSVYGHPSPLIQIFSNLISNSLKYRHPEIPPKVIIKAKELKKEWKFAVKDNGIGIEKEYYERIFNIFQRLHNKNEYSGTGMGLAIVKKIIEHLNGEIWLESEAGKGSTFYFTIPKSVNRKNGKR